jgi:membrane fusion protein (multidrug efflux system)
MRKTRTIVAVLIAIGFAAGLTGCGTQADAKGVAKKDKGPEPRAVEVATVAEGTLTPSYPATATLESEREATLVSEAPGEVQAVLVEEGDHVRKGQVLARLESVRERLEHERAAVEAKRLSHEAERGATLSARGLLSQQAAEQSAFAQQSQAAATQLAALTLAKTEIRAPYDGVITRRYVKQGMWLAATQAAFDIANFSDLKARISVPERAAAQLRTGQAVTLAADAVPGVNFSGRVERVAPIVDRATGTVAATIAVNGNDARLRPGLFVRLEVRYAEISDVTLLPKAALLKVNGESRVFVVREGKAQSRKVQIGLEQGEAVQAVSGIDHGESVVTVGQDQLADGDPVLVVNSGTEVASAGRAGS